MTKEQKRARLIDNLRQLLPDSIGLQWDQAVCLERQGHEMLITGNRKEAMNLYRESIKNKKNILTRFEGFRSEIDKKSLSLARSASYLANVCLQMEQFDEAEKTLWLLIEVAKTIETPEYKNDVCQLLQDAYRKIADLVPWSMSA